MKNWDIIRTREIKKRTTYEQVEAAAFSFSEEEAPNKCQRLERKTTKKNILNIIEGWHGVLGEKYGFGGEVPRYIAETYLTSVPSTVSIASTQEDLSDRLEKEQVSENYIFQILIAWLAPESRQHHSPCLSRLEEAPLEVSAPGSEK